METKRCIYCGSENKVDAEKCTICGGTFKREVQYENVDSMINRQKRTRPSVCVSIISVLLCILLFVSLISASVLTLIQKTLSNSNITKIIEETDLYDLVDAILKNETVEEYCKDYLFDQQYEDIITEKSLRKVLNSGIIKDFLCDKIKDYISDIKYENNLGYIGSKEVSKLFFKLYEKNEKTFGYHFSDSEKENIENVIDSFDYEMVTISDIRGDNPKLFWGLKALLTPLTIIVFLALIVISTIIIIIINKLYYKWWMKEIGITFLISGLVFGLSGLVSLFLLKKGNHLLRFIESATKNSCSILIYLTIGMLLIGIVLLLAEFIITKIKEKKGVKQNECF